MARHKNQIYYVDLFVVCRLNCAAVAAHSKPSAARFARDWYRGRPKDLVPKELTPSSEISHYLVRADGEPELEAELFESAKNPLIAILRDLVNYHDGAPHAKPLAEIIETARQCVCLLI